MGGWYKICSTLQPKNWSIVLVRVQCVLVSENDRLSQFIGIKHAFVAGGTPLTFTTFQSPKWFVYCLIQIHVTCVCLFFFICSPTFSCLQQLWGSYNDQDVVADGAESTHGILASRMEGNFTNLETARWIFCIDEMQWDDGDKPLKVVDNPSSVLSPTMDPDNQHMQINLTSLLQKFPWCLLCVFTGWQHEAWYPGISATSPRHVPLHPDLLATLPHLVAPATAEALPVVYLVVLGAADPLKLVQDLGGWMTRRLVGL